MMVQRFLVVAGMLLAFSGCATTSGGQSAADLQMKVTDLEKQVEAKDAEIKDLRYSLKDVSYEMDRNKATRTGGSASKSNYAKNDDILRVSVNPEKVQQALKTAGYYNGVVDGKLGNRTKVAVSKFQKDNGLKPDGVIGEKTWSLLKSKASE